MRVFVVAFALLLIGCAPRNPEPDVRELFPVAIEPAIDLGARDDEKLNSGFEVQMYFGYRKLVEPWQMLIGMSQANDDGLVRGKLGRVTEVLEVREFGSDSVAAHTVFVELSTSAGAMLGQPAACVEFHKHELMEFRKEWSVTGKYFAVLHARAHDDERVAVQWSVNVPPAVSKMEVPCSEYEHIPVAVPNSQLAAA